ncbi:MAG: glutamate racemase [Bacteroidia bacterium]|nr:glutamate racemase [Bacteroidia bacterium]MDW8014631.1 glutamate racemase [Bacteroidia bacterium]
MSKRKPLPEEKKHGSVTVGIFDSGLGGLLTARLLRAKRPDLSILYYGDTAHLPYGDKSEEQIQEYVWKIVRFLRGKGAEAIAIACNTASAVAYETAQAAAGSIPVYNAISPALKRFAQESLPSPVGVIGTYTTIRSGIYGRALRKMGYTVHELPTPLLVPLIEEGWIHHPATEAALHTYLSQLGEVKTLLLACTHYPLLEGLIEQYYAERQYPIQILSTAALLAEEMAQSLPHASKGCISFAHFWVSDANPRFIELAPRFWSEPIQLNEVKELSSGKGQRIAQIRKPPYF